VEVPHHDEKNPHRKFIDEKMVPKTFVSLTEWREKMQEKGGKLESN